MPLRPLILSIALIALSSATTFAASEALPDELTLKITATMHDQGEGRMRPSQEERTLILKRYTMRAVGFHLAHWTNGKMEIVTAPPVRTYRGYSKENPNERVCAVIYPNGTLDAMATTGFLNAWRTGEVQQVQDQIKGKPGTNDGRHLWPGGALTKRDQAPSPWEELPISGNLQRMKVLIDITTQCTTQKRTGGGWEAAIAWSEWQAMMGDQNYTRCLGKSLELVGEVIRMTDYYPSDKTPDLASFLVAVQDGWKKLKETWQEEYNKGSFDFANASTEHLSGGWTAGPFFFGTFMHELGHCFTLEHEIYGIDMQNPVAYGRALAAIKKNEWDTKRFKDTKPNENAMPVHPMPNPDIIITTPDKPVRMNVLANDYDANGSPIKITSFTPLTKRGGKVQKIEHLEKSGLKLDALGYIPAKGFIGKDAVIYTIENGLGLHQSEIVHIHVMDDKATIAGSWTLDQMDKGSSPDETKHGRNADLPKSAKSIQGVNKGAIEIASGDHIVLGDCDILPERPKDFKMRGNSIVGSWFPLEEDIGNDFDPLDQSYTLSFWFRRGEGTLTTTTSPGNNKPAAIPGILVDKGATADNNPVGYRLTTEGNKLTLFVREFNAYGKPARITHQDEFKTDHWHHIAIVIDRTGTNEARIYLDGKASSESIPLTKESFIFSGRADLRLCAAEGSSTAFDDVFIAYRAMPLGDIKKLFGRASSQVTARK